MDGPIDPTLLDELYGPALHADDWSAALERCVRQFGARDFALATSEKGLGVTGHFTTGRGLDEDARRQYRDHFYALDPKRALFEPAGPGFLFNDALHFDERFVAASTFYQEFSAPLGLRHTLDLFVAGDGKSELYVAAMRTARQGPFQAADASLIRGVGRHFERAHGLGRKLRAARTAAGVLDVLSFGVVVLDEAGRAALVNTAARRTLDSGEIRLVQGRLSARAPAVDRALQAGLDRARSDAPAEPSVLRAPRADGAAWIVWVMRLPASSALAAREAPGVLVLIGDSRRSGELGRQSVCGLFGLTEAEADLAIALARGRTLQEIADERGVRLSTVRSQLLAVLGKTGVHRQADLVRLLTTLPGAHLEGG